MPLPNYAVNGLPGAVLAAATSSMYLGRPPMEAGVAGLAAIGGEYLSQMISPSTGTVYKLENALAQGGVVFLADFFVFGHEDVVAGAIVGLSAVLGCYLGRKIMVNGQTLDQNIATTL